MKLYKTKSYYYQLFLQSLVKFRVQYVLDKSTFFFDKNCKILTFLECYKTLKCKIFSNIVIKYLIQYYKEFVIPKLSISKPLKNTLK